jgi:hypothetical protein
MFNAYDIEPDKPFSVGPARVTIDQDYPAPMPWEDMDGLAPLAWWSLGRGSWEAPRDGRGHDSDLVAALDGVSETWATRHRAAIWAALGLSETEAAQEEARVAHEARAWEASRPLVRLEEMARHLSEMETSDQVEAAAAIWRLRGFNVLAFQRNGYCQGDSVLGLLVHTRDFLERVGLGFPDKRTPEAIQADLEGDADLLAAWAFGDVYGYCIQDSETGETLDSCCGFYGAYWRKDSDVLAEAQAALEAAARDQAQEAQEAAQEARQAFLEVRSEWKATRAALGHLAAPGALCAALGRESRRLAETWAAARKRARAWAALIPQTETPNAGA